MWIVEVQEPGEEDFQPVAIIWDWGGVGICYRAAREIGWPPYSTDDEEHAKDVVLDLQGLGVQARYVPAPGDLTP